MIIWKKKPVNKIPHITKKFLWFPYLAGNGNYYWLEYWPVLNVYNSFYSKIHQTLLRYKHSPKWYEDMVVVKVSDFSTSPGARYKSQGEHSGEEFRETVLEPIFKEKFISFLLIDMDGTIGYSSAFIKEVFGGLVKSQGKLWVRNCVIIKSEEEPLLLKEIYDCIENTSEKK